MQNKTAQQIQAEIDFMRSMYERETLNHRRHETMVGWSLVTALLGVPILATAIVLILR